MKKRLLATFTAICMALSLLPVTAMATGEDDGTTQTMTLADFVTAVEKGSGTYNGNGAVVLIEPASGCWLASTSGHGRHTAGVKDSTPERLQGYSVTGGNSYYAQYQRFSGSMDISISNVTFRMVAPTGEIKVCDVWADEKSSKMTTATPNDLDAELQLLTTGSISFTGCTFEDVAVSPIDSTSSVSFTDCDFSGLAAYAVKDVKAATVSVTGCDFDSCDGGVYMNGAGTTSTIYADNTFTNIGGRAAIQFGATGDYSNAVLEITDNTFTNSGAVFRQLNKTITSAVLDTTTITATNTIDSSTGMLTADSAAVQLSTIYVDATNGNDSTGNGTETFPFKTIAGAMRKAKAGDTILVSGTIGNYFFDGINKPVTIQGAGDTRVAVSGGVTLPANVNGTVKLNNFSFNGTSTIGLYGSTTDTQYADLDLVIENCAFTQAYGNCVYIIPQINSLTVTGCTFSAPESQTTYDRQYLIWPYAAKTVTITNNAFDGRDVTRAAIHLGDGHPDGTTAVISGNTISNFERGVQLAFINSAANAVTIDNNTFNNIALSTHGTLAQPYEVATVFVHETLDKNGSDTTVNYTDNKLIGTSERVFYSENAKVDPTELVKTFSGNTINDTAIASLEDSWSDVFVAEVNGTKYKTLDDAISAANNNDTIRILQDIQLTSTISVKKILTFEGVTKNDGTKPVITYAGGIFSQSGDAVYTLKNLELQATADGQWYVYHSANTLTIENCDFTRADGVTNTGNVVMGEGDPETDADYALIFRNNTITANSRAALTGVGNGSQITGNTIDLIDEHWKGDSTSRTSMIALTAQAGGAGVTITGNTFKNANRAIAVDNSTLAADKITIQNNKFINVRYAFELSPEENKDCGTYDLNKNYFEFNGTVSEPKIENADASESHFEYGDGSNEYRPAGTSQVQNNEYYLDSSMDPEDLNTYVPPYTGGSSVSGDYIVSVDTTTGGKVTVSPGRADKGDTVTITVKPNEGYELDELFVTDKNGDTVKVTSKGNNKYTFTMPASKVTVEASFVKTGETDPSTLPFTDVNVGDYFYDAVAWAVENGVTAGTSATTFSPNASCTRAQTVTFLWRAAGSPEPKTTSNPFTDVKESDYYYEAVLWAVENSITAGTSATTFSPNAVCTRGQVVTFLYRYDGTATAAGTNFTDVSEGAYYYDAVQWAAQSGITTGTTATTFSPDANCTRGQIVTFLFRDLAE